MIKIYIVDDHPTLIEALINVFEDNSEIEIVGSASSGKEALAQVKTVNPDIILLDILMPEMDGVECCSILKKRFPDLKIIALTGEMNSGLLLKMWKQKPDGILIKACGLEELISTIKSVYNGRKVIGQNVPPFFDVDKEDRGDFPNLTKTELEVLKLLAEGITRQETADRMNRSMYTIEFHCKNILKKFNNNRIDSIIAKARKAKVIY